jgi:hypothetical protein
MNKHDPNECDFEAAMIEMRATLDELIKDIPSMRDAAMALETFNQSLMKPVWANMGIFTADGHFIPAPAPTYH